MLARLFVCFRYSEYTATKITVLNGTTYSPSLTIAPIHFLSLLVLNIPGEVFNYDFLDLKQK